MIQGITEGLVAISITKANRLLNLLEATEQKLQVSKLESKEGRPLTVLAIEWAARAAVTTVEVASVHVVATRGITLRRNVCTTPL